MGLNVFCPFSELNEMFDDCQFVPNKHRVFLNLITSFYKGKKAVFCHRSIVCVIKFRLFCSFVVISNFITHADPT
jgi:hypothetical protein